MQSIVNLLFFLSWAFFAHVQASQDDDREAFPPYSTPLNAQEFDQAQRALLGMLHPTQAGYKLRVPSVFSEALLKQIEDENFGQLTFKLVKSSLRNTTLFQENEKFYQLFRPFNQYTVQKVHANIRKYIQKFPASPHETWDSLELLNCVKCIRHVRDPALVAKNPRDNEKPVTNPLGDVLTPLLMNHILSKPNLSRTCIIDCYVEIIKVHHHILYNMRSNLAIEEGTGKNDWQKWHLNISMKNNDDGLLIPMDLSLLYANQIRLLTRVLTLDPEHHYAQMCMILYLFGKGKLFTWHQRENYKNYNTLLNPQLRGLIDKFQLLPDTKEKYNALIERTVKNNQTARPLDRDAYDVIMKILIPLNDKRIN